MDVSVIVPAAGSGKRFGAAENKIFRELCGQAVFLRTVALFAGRPDVCQIQLVVSREDVSHVREGHGDRLDRMGVTVVEGGVTRDQSVRNALACVADQADLVCVHDAVRPCVTHDLVDAVFAAASRTGAAILAVPVHGTVKKVAPDRTIERTVPRGGLWQAQTPQVFRRDLLLRAYESEMEGVTDDAQRVEALGHAVTVVPGDPTNVKITTPADLAFAEAVLKSRDVTATGSSPGACARCR